MSETRSKRYLFAPNGRVIERVNTECRTTAHINMVDAYGGVDGLQYEDFPQMDVSGDGFVLDINGVDFRLSDCRLVVVMDDDEFDPHITEGGIEPWPDEIVDLCSRADWLAYALLRLDDFRSFLPPDCRADTTMAAALDVLVKGRLEAELQTIDEKIAAFRKDRVEPTTWSPPEGEDDDPDYDDQGNLRAGSNH